MKLANQVAIVTGGESGIGAAISRLFARDGADLLIVYHEDEQAAAEVQREVEQSGRRGVVAKADVGMPDDVERLFGTCRAELGLPTILVNSAGINASGACVADMAIEDWEARIRTNLTGCFLTCRLFIRGLRDAGRPGKIINITSVHQEIPRAGGADYDASKGGLGNLTTTLALELAPLRINVNNLAPGMILTPMNQEEVDDPKKLAESIENIPWKRAGEPEEVASLALYLASADADYVTGATFVIDGGLSLNLGQGA